MASSRDFVPATLRAEVEIESFERTVGPPDLSVFMVLVTDRQRAHSPYSRTPKFVNPSFVPL